MKKPNNPEEIIGVRVYLTKNIHLGAVGSGTNVHAPKNLEVIVVNIYDDGNPGVACKALVGWLYPSVKLRWSHLKKEAPTCKTCKQSLAKEALFYTHPDDD